MRNVQQIQASESAFAAILGDGSVVTWGDAQCGGDSSAVQDQLKNEQQIQATDHAFAAILGDGSVVTWRNDSCAVQDQLKNVQQIQGSQSAFAAIIGDGSVVIWGAIGNGDVSSAVKDQLKNVQQIHANLFGLAAILGDVRGRSGGWCCAGSAETKCATDSCQFPRFRRHSWGDGSVVTWGVMVHGGDSSAVQNQLNNVQQIHASWGAFAAILGDGSVAAAGGDSSVVQDQLKNLQQIQASYGAFAAILGDESIVTWGDFRL